MIVVLVLAVLAVVATLLYFFYDDLKEQKRQMGEFPKILRDAHAGDLYSQIKLVQIYRSDGVVPTNLPEAQKWAHIAVGRGSPEGAMLLSEMYMKGEGVSIDPLESERLCRLAAEAGFDRAQWSLSKMYLEGVVLERDVNAALKWLHSSAAQGYESAIMDLAEIYEAGNIVPQDNVLAYLYYSLALKADYLGRGKTHPAWAAAVRIKSDLSSDQIQKAEEMEARVLELRATKAIGTTLIEKIGMSTTEKDHATAIFFASTLIGEGYDDYRKEYFSGHPQCQKIDDGALRFSFLVVSAAVAVIAINHVLPSSRRNPVIKLFFEEVERRFAAFTTPIYKVGFSIDEITKSKNEAILLAQAIPEASALALVDVPFLFGLMMKFRTRLYINAYLNSNDQPLLGGRMADVAFLYVEHLLGDDAFSSPTSQNDGINSILRMQLTTIFNTDLQTICENTPAALRGQ